VEGGGGYANELKSRSGWVVREDGGIIELGWWRLKHRLGLDRIGYSFSKNLLVN